MKNLALFVLVTISLLGSAFAAGQIDISYSPYTISKPGSYIVVKDLSASLGQDAICINTCNVTLDLNGHTLSGAGSATGTTSMGIHDIGGFLIDNNVTIKNGTIVNFNDDAVYGLTNNWQIIGINISNCGKSGIGIYGNAIIKDNNINNVAINPVNNYGIFSGYGSLITGNSINNCLGNGIDGYGCRIEKNQIYQCSGDGIIAESLCFVSENSIIDSGDTTYTAAGILVNGPCTIRNNFINGTSGDGIRLHNSASRVMDNTVDNTAHGAGIYVTSGSNGNTIENNFLYGNQTGLWINSNSNYYSQNRFHANSYSTVTSFSSNVAGDGYSGFSSAQY